MGFATARRVVTSSLCVSTVMATHNYRQHYGDTFIDLTLHAAPGPQWPDCNGNGIIYTDTNTCECFECYTGPACGTFMGETCVINDGPGNPLLHQEFWAFHPNGRNATTVSPGAYRSGYTVNNNVWSPGCTQENEDTGLSGALSTVIRKLHRIVGNAKTEGYYIVPGSGATGLIAASMYALSQIHGSTQVYARAPYYSGYKSAAEMIRKLDYCNLQIQEDVSVPAKCVTHDGTPVTNSDDIIEYVTVPNNPDNAYNVPMYPRSRVVYDFAYNWPHVTTDHTPTKDFAGDIMLFTLSKLSGHAGTRFGWALVKEKAVAMAMGDYTRRSQVEVSHDTLHRAFVLLDTIANVPNQFFPYIRNTMQNRNKDLQEVFHSVTSFTLKSKPDDATFYVWLKCNVCDDGNGSSETAADLFKRKTGVVVSPGSIFGYAPSYVRLEMVVRSHTWPLFITRLTRLE